MRRTNASLLVALSILAWTMCLAKAAFLMKCSNPLPGPRVLTETIMTATTMTSAIASNWWPPSSRRGSSASLMDKTQGIVPGSFCEFDLYHQHQQPNHEMHLHALPHDPLAAVTLRNIVHQAACDALIYNSRWKFCMAVWDDRLLDWLIEAACPGNFWTPKTYMVLATADETTERGVTIEDHLIWHHWEGTKAMFLSSDSDPSDGTKKLRSLASRILPRLSNSGRRATDLPVFDTVIMSSSQLLRLRDHVESELQAQTDMSLKINNARRTKRRKATLQNMPWVISLPSNSQPLNILSLNVLQAAKQVVVVCDRDSWNVDWNGILEETRTQYIWLGTFPERRFCCNQQDDDVATCSLHSNHIRSQSQEDVSCGNV
jgi:hypothetical protein